MGRWFREVGEDSGRQREVLERLVEDINELAETAFDAFVEPAESAEEDVPLIGKEYIVTKIQRPNDHTLIVEAKSRLTG